MGLAQLWDLSFTSFEAFVGVSVLWLLFVEPRFPVAGLSVPVMGVLSVLAAGFVFVRGWRGIQHVRREAQKQIESATASYEEEIG